MASRQKTEADAPSSPTKEYVFNGIQYDTYQDMVKAKRQRNEQVLQATGLLDVVAASKKATKATTKKRKSDPLPRRESSRQSKRLQGVASDGLYVEHERAGKFTVAVEDGNVTVLDGSSPTSVLPANPEQQLLEKLHTIDTWTVEDAVKATGSKWYEGQETIDHSQGLLKNVLVEEEPPQDETKSACNFSERISATDVAKVTPDRIYSVAVHPSRSNVIVAAGDKQGHVGIWNQTATSDEKHSSCLLRVHTGATCSLAWLHNGRSLLSASYDGTVRISDGERYEFRTIFRATEEKDSILPGAGIVPDGLASRFWTQYAVPDIRSPDDCLFLTTSLGDVLHLDTRMKGSITWQEKWSEKKINTVRYVFCVCATGRLARLHHSITHRLFVYSNKNNATVFIPTVIP